MGNLQYSSNIENAKIKKSKFEVSQKKSEITKEII